MGVVNLTALTDFFLSFKHLFALLTPVHNPVCAWKLFAQI